MHVPGLVMYALFLWLAEGLSREPVFVWRLSAWFSFV